VILTFTDVQYPTICRFSRFFHLQQFKFNSAFCVCNLTALACCMKKPHSALHTFDNNISYPIFKYQRRVTRDQDNYILVFTTRTNYYHLNLISFGASPSPNKIFALNADLERQVLRHSL